MVIGQVVLGVLPPSARKHGCIAAITWSQCPPWRARRRSGRIPRRGGSAAAPRTGGRPRGVLPLSLGPETLRPKARSRRMVYAGIVFPASQKVADIEISKVQRILPLLGGVHRSAVGIQAHKEGSEQRAWYVA